MFDSINNLGLGFGIIVLCLIGLDVLSGIIKGAATKSLSSEKMRIGFWHKSANIILLILSYGAGFSNKIIDGMPEWTIGIYAFTCSYLSLMELTSILENLVEINPELNDKKLFEKFGILKGKNNED